MGLLWIKPVGRRYLIKNGISLFHINGPDQANSTIQSTLPLRYAFHHTSIVKVNEKVNFTPRVQVLYSNGATNHVMVLEARKQLNLETAVYAGVGFRGYIWRNDAAIFNFGFEKGYVDFGFSYDINVSSLSESINGKNTVEFTAMFRSPPKRYKPLKKRTICPLDQPLW